MDPLKVKAKELFIAENGHAPQTYKEWGQALNRFEDMYQTGFTKYGKIPSMKKAGKSWLTGSWENHILEGGPKPNKAKEVKVKKVPIFTKKDPIVVYNPPIKFEYNREASYVLKNWLRSCVRVLKEKDGEQERLAKIALKAVNARLTDYKDGSMSTYSYRYNTQKVRGLMSGHGRELPGVRNGNENIRIFPYQFPKLEEGKQYFARPAPTRPRHGFVESREVKTFEDVEAIWKETIAQDPEGELIIMPKLTGDFSAVAHNAGVTWGYGNDGVTDGTGNTVTVPVVTEVEQWNNAIMGAKRYWEEEVKGSIYLELVQNRRDVASYKDVMKKKDDVVLVQRRDGPPQVAEANYIPRKTKIKKVLSRYDTYGDLIAWEKHIKTAVEQNKGTEGLVIHLPGTTLASHWAVHGIEMGIPVVTDKPIHSIGAGDVLEPTSVQFKELNDRDYKVLARMISRLERKDFLHAYALRTTGHAIYTASGTIHAMSQWENDHHLMRLRAIAMVTLPRVILAACAGELRHWNRSGPGTEGEVMKTTSVKTYNRDDPGSGRYGVWKNFIKPLPLPEQRRHFMTITEDFNTKGWDSGYGGEKWGKISAVAQRMARNLSNFKKRPNKRTWTALALSANMAMHMVHNGSGSSLSKWVSQEHLTAISKAPALGFLNPFAMKVILNQRIVKPKVIGGVGPDEYTDRAEQRDDDITPDTMAVADNQSNDDGKTYG